MASWSLLPSRDLDSPGFRYQTSPSDWRTTTIYQIITDRFYDGDHANNTAHPGAVYNPLSMDSLHGGDFAGIIQHLDYICDLGFNVIWISPVHFNHRGAYHGYHIMDFNRIDLHWGSLEELRTLIDAAHARGMYVIIDVVFNHMARLLTSDDAGFPQFSKSPYAMRWSDPATQFPPPFDSIDYFHGHGSIQNWEDNDQNVLGDLQGLADLRTERPDIRQWLLESHLALIAATDCDGFRIDTAHHVELDFWQEILPKIKAGASALGKTNFLMFAEVLRGRDEDVAIHTREGEYPSALYYPFYFTLQDIWVSRHPTRKITERWNHLSLYGESARKQLVAFGDNHDRARLLNSSYLQGDTNRVKALLTLLFASPSIPCVYYGTEQGFSGSKGHGAREPMFHPSANGMTDHFDTQHELALFIQRINRIRKTYPALQTGDWTVHHDEPQAGVFAFTRSLPDDIVWIVLNNSETPREYAIDGEWVDVMTGNPYDGKVAADSANILVAREGYQEVSPATHNTFKRQPVDREQRHPFSSFIADGQRDDQAMQLASNDTTSLYVAYDAKTRMFYVATTPAAEGFDRFIMLAYSNHRASVAAPWKKTGSVPGYDILISDEGDSDYTSVRGIRGIHWSTGQRDGVLEAAFQLPEVVTTLRIRTETYTTEDRGIRQDATTLPDTNSPVPWLDVSLDLLNDP